MRRIIFSKTNCFSYLPHSTLDYFSFLFWIFFFSLAGFYKYFHASLWPLLPDIRAKEKKKEKKEKEERDRSALRKEVKCKPRDSKILLWYASIVNESARWRTSLAQVTSLKRSLPFRSIFSNHRDLQLSLKFYFFLLINC